MYDEKVNEENFPLLVNEQTRQKAIERLIENNKGLVVRVAKTFIIQKEDIFDKNDLEAIGSIGLLKAIKTFDNTKSKFVTYAVRCITNEILMDLKKFKRQRVDQNGKSVISGSFNKESLEDKESLIEKVPDTIKTPEEKYIEIENHKEFVNLLTKLEPRQAQVLILKFGLFESKIYTQKEISQIMGGTPENVGNMVRSAKAKLRWLIEQNQIIEDFHHENR